MMRSWAYNRFGVLMGTSWPASCPHWHGLREVSWPMITLFHSQGDFYATAARPWSSQNSTSYTFGASISTTAPASPRCNNTSSAWTSSSNATVSKSLTSRFIALSFPLQHVTTRQAWDVFILSPRNIQEPLLQCLCISGCQAQYSFEHMRLMAPHPVRGV